MTATVAAPVRAIAPARPDVLAHPSPTIGRFLLLIAALLGAGLLAGNLVHNGVVGRQWADAVRACLAQEGAGPAPSDLDSQVAQQRAFSACMGPAERARALFGVGGAAAMGVLALGVALAVPAVLRRRYRLRPAGPRLDGAVERIAELARETGLRRPPRLLIGPAGQRDAFVFGRPGRYELVLPTALVVRWRNPALFDPVVRHELAHQRRHDVPLAWLATGVWLAALPVLAVPVVLALARRSFDLLPPYLWRAAVVLGVVWLVRRQALRSREHDADLHAARQAGDWRPVAGVLGAGRPVAGWRRLVSNHPTPAQRVAVLTDPGRSRSVSIVDALAAGFLTAVLLPPVLNVILVALNGPAVGWAPHMAAALVGPLTGLAVGVGLWRQAMVDRVTGARTWPGGAVLGVVAGLLLGLPIRLNDLGAGEAWAGVVPVAIVFGTAAVLLSAGTGRLWADAAARLPGGARSWWIGIVVNALIFGIALWATQWVPVTLAAAGASGLGAAGFAIAFGGLVGPVVYVAAVPLVVALAAMVWRRAPEPTPAWLVEGRAPGRLDASGAGGAPGRLDASGAGGAPPWSYAARRPGLTATLLSGAIPGVLAALAVLLQRLVAGRPTSDEESLGRYLAWLVVGTLVALVVSFVTMVVVPRSGPAVGLVSGAVAAVTAALGMLATNSIMSRDVDPHFWRLTIVGMAALWLAGFLMMLPVTLAVWPAPWRDVSGWIVLPVVAGVGGFTALVSAAVLVAG